MPHTVICSKYLSLMQYNRQVKMTENISHFILPYASSMVAVFTVEFANSCGKCRTKRFESLQCCHKNNKYNFTPLALHCTLCTFTWNTKLWLNFPSYNLNIEFLSYFQTKYFANYLVRYGLWPMHVQYLYNYFFPHPSSLHLHNYIIANIVQLSLVHLQFVVLFVIR